ncbi:MAG: hypothetical protein IJ838_04170 [Paludibacteraceae bacterium]|nr:hypothetical protein [Paludibacteraceae bacterium]
MKTKKMYISPITDMLDLTTQGIVMLDLGPLSGLGEPAPERRNSPSHSAWK